MHAEHQHDMDRSMYFVFNLLDRSLKPICRNTILTEVFANPKALSLDEKNWNLVQLKVLRFLFSLLAIYEDTNRAQHDSN